MQYFGAIASYNPSHYGAEDSVDRDQQEGHHIDVEVIGKPAATSLVSPSPGSDSAQAGQAAQCPEQTDIEGHAVASQLATAGTDADTVSEVQRITAIAEDIADGKTVSREVVSGALEDAGKVIVDLREKSMYAEANELEKMVGRLEVPKLMQTTSWRNYQAPHQG